MPKVRQNIGLKPVAARGGGRPPRDFDPPPLWGGENSQTYEIFFPLEINVV